MPATYDPTQLASSPLMQVRFELADTAVDQPLLDDGEIEYALSVERNLYSAAARCAESIARMFLAKADVQLGRHLHVVYSKMADQYRQMAKELRTKGINSGGGGVSGAGVPWAGGLSVAEKLAAEADTGSVQPAFRRSMMDNPRVGGSGADPVDDRRGLL